MIIEKFLNLFQVIMALVALIFFITAPGESTKATGSPKGLPTPSFIFGQTFLGTIFVAQMAHFIIRRPTDAISIATAVTSFIVIVLIILKFAWHYRRLYRLATGQAS